MHKMKLLMLPIATLSRMSDYYYKIADFAELPKPPCVPMSDAQLQFPILESGFEDCFKQPI